MIIHYTIESIIDEGEILPDFKNKRIMIPVKLVVVSDYSSAMEVSRTFELNNWKKIKKLGTFEA